MKNALLQDIEDDTQAAGCIMDDVHTLARHLASNCEHDADPPLAALRLIAMACEQAQHLTGEIEKAVMTLQREEREA